MSNTLRDRLIALCVAITSLSLLTLGTGKFAVECTNTQQSTDNRMGQLTRIHAAELAEWVGDKQRIAL